MIPRIPLQAYAQDRGLGWLLHANGDDTNDISKYEDMQSEKYKNLKTTGEDATDEDKEKAQRWIHDSSVLAGILRRSCHRDPLGRNIVGLACACCMTQAYRKLFLSLRSRFMV